MYNKKSTRTVQIRKNKSVRHEKKQQTLSAIVIYSFLSIVFLTEISVDICLASLIPDAAYAIAYSDLIRNK